MKRTALTRRTPLKRGGSLRREAPIARRTRLRPVNRERKLERYEAAFGDRAELVRAMPCLLLGTECWGPIEAAHVRSRGAGGTRRDLVPLCSKHHREQHDTGIKTFAARHGIDLHAAADRLARELDERRVP